MFNALGLHLATYQQYILSTMTMTLTLATLLIMHRISILIGYRAIDVLVAV